MTEEEISEFCIRLAFLYESAIGALLAKGLMKSIQGCFHINSLPNKSSSSHYYSRKGVLLHGNLQ